jgi:ribosomal protein L17
VKIIEETTRGAVERRPDRAELLTLARAGDVTARRELLRVLVASQPKGWRHRLNGRMERGRG